MNYWLESQIKINNIKYFNYSEFSDIVNVGEGGSGIVCKSNWNSRRMTVAMKVLKTSSSINKSAIDEFVSEFTLLQKVVYHPNINQFIGITKDPEFGYAMVLQYAEGGNLRNYLKCHILSWFDKCRIAFEIAKGLLCLHAEDIVHRDLHSKNVLICQGRMLIADFGLSKEETLTTSYSAVSGMPAYVDPQCHKQKGYRRTKASDIFSFGVLLWEISSGKVPFYKHSHFTIILNLVNGIREQRIDGTPEEYFKLYTKCWDDNPRKRPNIEEIVETLEGSRISLNDILSSNSVATLPTLPTLPQISYFQNSNSLPNNPENSNFNDFHMTDPLDALKINSDDDEPIYPQKAPVQLGNWNSAPVQPDSLGSRSVSQQAPVQSDNWNSAPQKAPVQPDGCDSTPVQQVSQQVSVQPDGWNSAPQKAPTQPDGLDSIPVQQVSQQTSAQEE